MMWVMGMRRRRTTIRGKGRGGGGDRGGRATRGARSGGGPHPARSYDSSSEGRRGGGALLLATLQGPGDAGAPEKVRRKSWKLNYGIHAFTQENARSSRREDLQVAHRSQTTRRAPPGEDMVQGKGKAALVHSQSLSLSDDDDTLSLPSTSRRPRLSRSRSLRKIKAFIKRTTSSRKRSLRRALSHKQLASTDSFSSSASDDGTTTTTMKGPRSPTRMRLPTDDALLGESAEGFSLTGSEGELGRSTDGTPKASRSSGRKLGHLSVDIKSTSSHIMDTVNDGFDSLPTEQKDVWENWAASRLRPRRKLQWWKIVLYPNRSRPFPWQLMLINAVWCTVLVTVSVERTNERARAHSRKRGTPNLPRTHARANPRSMD